MRGILLAMTANLDALKSISAFAALMLLLMPAPSRACAWDSDTLEQEARGLPDVVQIVTGRFERNPPLYYEMRLKRVAAELAHDPAKLEDYDDAGVACDHLHRDGDALRWMAGKRAQLAKLHDGKIPVTGIWREQWYRYYANVGTFRVHRWLTQNPKSRRLSELIQARNEIARALEINPDAHFGRERVQLGVMDWILQNAPSAVNGGKSKDNKKPVRLSEFLNQGVTGEWDDTPQAANVVKGLCGLIALGNAWESVDVFEALSRVLSRKENVRYLANQRAQELIAQGRYSLLPGSSKNSNLVQELELDSVRISNPAILGNLRRQWPRLRAEAEAWQARRTAYMMTRLQAGRHPDTDPGFWREYRELPPPSLELSRFERFRVYMNSNEGILLTLVFVLLSALTAFAIAIKFSVSWWRKKRGAQRHTPA